MLKPKVRTLIDGLPFITEGYDRANKILKSKYGIEREIENAPVQGLIPLPATNNSNSQKINKF